MHVPILPSKEEFIQIAESGANVIPVYTKLAADAETPLTAYLKLKEGTYSYLFESAESAAASGRWSILGVGASIVFESRDHKFFKKNMLTGEVSESSEEVLTALQDEMANYLPFLKKEANAPPFLGGLVGYLSYDASSQFEPTIQKNERDDLNLPDAVYFLSDKIVALKKSSTLVCIGRI